MEIEKHWQEIFGEAMPPEVLTRILKIQKIMNIKDDDAVWQILIPMEFYQRLHEQIPASMRVEVDVVTRQVKEASAQVIRSAAAEIEKSQTNAKAEIETMTARTKQEIAKALGQGMSGAVNQAINQITQSVAVQEAKSQARKWLAIGGGVILLTILLSGGAAWYYFSGQIDRIKIAAAAKIRQIENTPPTTLSLSCNAPGEQIQVGNDGQRWCTRLLPPQ
ncbi:MAG: hypothetical protein D084_Lepto4C00431G0009 [Leptospirillum sp. Group IV 'UBA BS']|nr:MAG: hypothetical protein D084_Lepto4C00431G0009 [Leptospirillum sp. Group IV 'UBA BS']